MTEEQGAGRDDVLAALRLAVGATRPVEGRPVRVHNHLMTALTDVCARMSASATGREALVWAAQADPDPAVRLHAATTVATWDVNAATRALREIVVASGGIVVKPMTMAGALAVPGGVSRSAALCLYDLDRGSRASTSVVGVRSIDSAGANVPRAELDAAEAVYSLAMNGGIDHAYELAGTEFPAAARAFDAGDAGDAARILREVVKLLDATNRIPEDRELRWATLRDLSEASEQQLAELGHRLSSKAELMDLLEPAVET